MTVLPTIFQQHLPDTLQTQGEQAFSKLESQLSPDEKSRLESLLEADQVLKPQLVKACIASEYLLESCCREPVLLLEWLLVDTPYAPLSAARITQMVELSCCDCESVEALDRELRRLRRRIMLAIIWRDLNGLSDFAELCQSMTSLAEATIDQALNFHYRALSAKYGTPMGKDSHQPQPFLVLGMGKLGGGELNVSSDIDLIFTFPEAGVTDSPENPLDNQAFFTRLGKQLIKSLNTVTVDGFVFRVDMRLRPYGQSGALVSSFAALENYYETQGRDWERFAAIKARVVAFSHPLISNDESLAIPHQAIESLETILQPFTYRRYTDFSVIESLRKLKAMIVQEVKRKGMDGNVKLGSGGIRELEFIAQSFQLVSGGREPQLRERHWLESMAQLELMGVFEEGVVDALIEAYRFLRNTEHAIQYYQDQQTQQLPVDSTQQAILAWVMGSDSWEGFIEVLDQHRSQVSEQFQLVIAPAREKSAQITIDQTCHSLWQQACSGESFDDTHTAYLENHGCGEPEQILEYLQRMGSGWTMRRLSDSSRAAIDQLMPQVMTTVLQLDSPDVAMIRMLEWLEKIIGRSSYITLLLENPSVLRHITVLFEGSLWVAELLGQMPSLLDELLNTDTLYSLPTKAELKDELRVRLLRVEPDDIESTMEVLRYFKLAHSLRIAASDLAGSLPLMNVSDYLTWIAEAVLDEVLSLAWQQLSARHGVPAGGEAVVCEGQCALVPGFVIIAYGKMGGIELSYSSDLDLVFIYQADAQGMTNGDKPIDVQTFYTRLGQKIIHILNTRTLSGPLYEVDMRLRPSGNSGLLASSMQAFDRYQQKDAWTWEHQALVRARPVAGDESLAEAFIALREKLLCESRTEDTLKRDVCEMRQKMRDHLGSASQSKGQNAKNMPKKPLFHLKQDAGGIVDIEFMVQYAVLAWAHQKPSIAHYTDNIRILEQVHASGLMEAERVLMLIENYKAYRELAHRLALQQRSSLIDQACWEEYALAGKCQQVKELWQQLLCDGTDL